ncbi:MAG: hypothetical protein R3D80_10590 [Paracoccaceae bacterium]
MPRETAVGAEVSQMFLFENVEKWFPGGGPGRSLHSREITAPVVPGRRALGDAASLTRLRPAGRRARHDVQVQGARLFGWRNACPHYGNARMAWKKDEYLNGDRSRIVCGAHGAQFEIETGCACVLGPRLGRSLIPVPLTVRDGAVSSSPPRMPRPAPAARLPSHLKEIPCPAVSSICPCRSRWASPGPAAAAEDHLRPRLRRRRVRADGGSGRRTCWTGPGRSRRSPDHHLLSALMDAPWHYHPTMNGASAPSPSTRCR